MLEILFSKVAGLQDRYFSKKRLQHRCFFVNIAKFLRTAFFIEHLLLDASVLVIVFPRPEAGVRRCSAK